MAVNQGEASQIQDSLRLSEPAELVGAWVITDGQRPCAVEFTQQTLNGANAFVLHDNEQCVDSLIGGVAGWRAAPDGIALVDAGGATLVFFDAQGQGRTRAAASLRLARALPGDQP